MKYLGRISDPKDWVTKEYVDDFIATAEYDASHASQAYSVGDYLILNKIIYQVTSPIAANESITPGTNCAVAGDLTDIIADQTKQISVTFATSDFVANSDNTIPADYVGTKTVSGLNSALDYHAALGVAPGSIATVLAAKFLPINKLAAGILYLYCNAVPSASITVNGTFTRV